MTDAKSPRIISPESRMLAVLTIVTPVFALMALGYLLSRFRVLPEGGGAALAQFAFKIAIPAMLFRAMLNAGAMPPALVGFLIAYFTAVILVWIVAILSARTALGRAAEDAPSIAMAATFGNTVMLGLPIAVTAFGPDAAVPLAILVAVEAPILWIAATVQIEIARRGAITSGGAFGAVLRDLATNMVILSLLLGIMGRTAGLVLPEAADRFLTLLGQAGVPVALIALGMVLSQFRLAGEWRAMLTISAMKLALLPAAVFVVAHGVFALPPLLTAVMVLHAAMPVGANAFLFATRYDREAPVVSAAIVLSTLIGVVSVSVVLLLLQPIVGR
jgi:malonate transporter and related proteins